MCHSDLHSQQEWFQSFFKKLESKNNEAKSTHSQVWGRSVVTRQKADTFWRMMWTVGTCEWNREMQASHISALSRNRVWGFQIHFWEYHFAVGEAWGRKFLKSLQAQSSLFTKVRQKGPAKQQNSWIPHSLCQEWGAKRNGLFGPF